MRLFIPILYGGFGAYLFVMYQNLFGLIGFGVVAVLWYMLYPKYQKHRYRNHFLNHVIDSCKNRINIPIEFEMDSEYVYSRDAGSESKIKRSELASLIELKERFFLKMKTDVSLIIPKSAISNIDSFKAEIAQIGIPCIDELDWEFK